MSGDRYIISDKAGCYFVTFTIIHWIDIFTRRDYRDIILLPPTPPTRPRLQTRMPHTLTPNS